MTNIINDHSISNPHDLGYKELLSHRQICMDLIHCCIEAEWAQQIDESYFKDKTKNFILPRFLLKEADTILELKLKDREVYFYILQELQSTVDFLMPYRLLSYMVEIWRQVIKKAENKAYNKDFRLPIIVPIVLYNGKNNWTAHRNLKEIMEYHEYFKRFIPDFHYLLIDINRYNKDYLKNLSNSIGAIFLLDQKYDIMELNERLHDASPGIKTLELTAFASFKDWFECIICDQLTPEEKSGFLKILKQTSHEEAGIMLSNLAETIREAKENSKKEGIEIGSEKGIEKVAKNMIIRNLPYNAIADVTELPLSEIIRLAEQI